MTVDAIECELHDFGERTKSEAYSSGKKHRTTIKYQIAIQIANGEIVNVVYGIVGSQADINVLMTCDMIKKLLPRERILVDRGYLNAEIADLTVVAFKKPSTQEQLDWNNLVSSVRIEIERINAYFKRHRILRFTWIKNVAFHLLVFNGIAHMINLRLKEFPSRRYIAPNLVFSKVHKPVQ